jgi:hypothetical protein
MMVLILKIGISSIKNNATSFGDNDLFGVTKDLSLNFEKFNWMVLEVRLNTIGEKSVRRIINIPIEKIRFECRSENGSFALTGNLKVSDDWMNDRVTTRTLMPYDPTNEAQRIFYVIYKENSGQSLESLNSKKVTPCIYPDPTYSGAITAIDTGIAVQTHGNTEIHNNFSLGSIIALNNGAPKK